MQIFKELFFTLKVLKISNLKALRIDTFFEQILMPILNTLPARAKAYIIGAMYGRIVTAGSYAFALAGRKPGTDYNTQGAASLYLGLCAGCPCG